MVKTEKDDAGHFMAVPPPSAHVLGSVGLSLTIATFIAVYWDDSIVLGSGFGMQGIGWKNAILVWAWALMWFVITELIKFIVLCLWDETEKDRDGQSFFRSILGLGWGRDYARQDQEELVEQLRESLRMYDTSSYLDNQLAPVTGSSRLGPSSFSLGLSLGLASLTQDDHGSNNKVETMQDMLLSSETLQSDPHLMRMVSQLVFAMAKMQDRLDQIEGVERSKRLTLKKNR